MLFKFFNTNLKSFKHITFLLMVFAFSNVAEATNNNILDNEPSIFQIVDKYNEVKLSLTESSIFMHVKSSVKEYTNYEIEQRHHIEASRFIDSQGHFLLGELVLLNSERIEYNLEDVELNFKDGKLIFKYHRTKSITFEEILNTNGTPAIQNFDPEDLEQFYMVYKKLTKYDAPITKD